MHATYLSYWSNYRNNVRSSSSSGVQIIFRVHGLIRHSQSTSNTEARPHRLNPTQLECVDLVDDVQLKSSNRAGFFTLASGTTTQVPRYCAPAPTFLPFTSLDHCAERGLRLTLLISCRAVLDYCHLLCLLAPGLIRPNPPFRAPNNTLGKAPLALNLHLLVSLSFAAEPLCPQSPANL